MSTAVKHRTAKKSLVIEPDVLRELMATGEFANESEAVRYAMKVAVAARGALAAAEEIRRSGAFGRAKGRQA